MIAKGATPVKRLPMREVRLRNFRCFHEEQSARIAPLTLLVGENSTGKTSFLAAVRALCETISEDSEHDFHKPPYDLGTFFDIVHSRTGRVGDASSFALGLNTGFPARQTKFDVSFVAEGAEPTPKWMAWEKGDLRIKVTWLTNRQIVVEMRSPDGSWVYETKSAFSGSRTIPQFFFFYIGRAIESEGKLTVLDGELEKPSRKQTSRFGSLQTRLRRRFERHGIFAGAPIRSNPRRTYDSTSPVPDPEGAYVPTYLSNLDFRDQQTWQGVKEGLEQFGKNSGLFDEISLQRFTKTEGGPFQIKVRKFTPKRKDPKRNLIDVGYGVSQALPVVTELLKPDAPQLCLFQQPEVHLHPSAQAAVGSLFCQSVMSGRQLIVETHSDYIVDRVRMEIRDGTIGLEPDDVSLLFFERSELEARIHSLRFDDQGNILNAPESYGKFFLDEMQRSFGF